MSARIRSEGALAAALLSALLAMPTARAQSCSADDVYVSFNTYLGGPQADEVRDLQFAPGPEGQAGELLITGQTKSSTLGQGNTSQSGLDNNIFVARLSADGTRVRWSFLFGSDGDDSGAQVAAGPSGEVYVVGRVSKGVNINPSSYNFNKVYSTAGGQTDAFLARLTADGKPDWFLYLSSAQDEEALGLTLTRDAVYVVGKTRASLTDQFPSAIPPTGARYGRTGSDGSNFDAFIVKVPLSAPSTPAWVRILATQPASNSKADDLAQTVLVQDRDLYVGGQLEGAPAGDNGTLPADARCGASVAGVVMKLDVDGNAKWISCLGSKESGRERGTTVQTLLFSSRNELLAAGDTAAPDFLPKAGPNSGRDLFAHALSSEGNPLGGLRVAAPGIQQVRGRAALHPVTGKVLIGGWTDTSLFEGKTLSGRDVADIFNAPDGEGFVVSLAADLTRLDWGVYVGGADGKTQESVTAVAADKNTGLLAVAGTSSATHLMRVKTGAELKAPDLQNGFVFGLKPDPTPPQSNPDKPIEVRLDEQGHLEVSWKDVFTDPESGIASYTWSVLRANASTPEFTRTVTSEQAQAELDPTARYTVQLQATNGAGCTTTRSQPIGEDPSAPGGTQSPLGWTCGVSDGGLAPFCAGLLLVLTRRARRTRDTPSRPGLPG